MGPRSVPTGAGDGGHGRGLPRRRDHAGPRRDDKVLRLLYDDIEGDQRFYDIFALLILLGAAFAAFNLIGARRRGPAQGDRHRHGARSPACPHRPSPPPRRRPGRGARRGVRRRRRAAHQRPDGRSAAGFSRCPSGRSPSSPGSSSGRPSGSSCRSRRRPTRASSRPRGPGGGDPTADRAVSGGLAPLVRRLPLPGSTVALLPVRNVVRGPRRTVLTALGVAGHRRPHRGDRDDRLVQCHHRPREEEFVGGHPEQLTVGVDFAPIDSDAVRAVTESPLVADAEPGLALGGARPASTTWTCSSR